MGKYRQATHAVTAFITVVNLVSDMMSTPFPSSLSSYRLNELMLNYSNQHTCPHSPQNPDTVAKEDLSRLLVMPVCACHRCDNSPRVWS